MNERNKQESHTRRKGGVESTMVNYTYNYNTNANELPNSYAQQKAQRNTTGLKNKAYPKSYKCFSFLDMIGD